MSFLDQLPPIAIRKADIREEQIIGTRLLQTPARVCARSDRFHTMPHPFQNPAQELAAIFVILHHEEVQGVTRPNRNGRCAFGLV